MTSIAHEENPAEPLVIAGLASSILDELRALVEATRNGSIREFKRLTWNAGQPVSWDTGGAVAGFVLINESSATCYVDTTQGGAKGVVAASNPIGTIAVPAGGWITMPLETSVVYVGSDVAGSALVLPLDAPPQPFVGGQTGIGLAAASLPTLTTGQRSGLLLTPKGAQWETLIDLVGNPIDSDNLGNEGVGTSARGLLVGAWNRVFNGSSWDRLRTPNVFKPIKNVAITAGTPVSVWTPAAGKKFRVMGWVLSLSVAGFVNFEDAAGSGNEFARTPAMAAGVGLASPPSLGNGYLSAAANNQLFLDVNATGNVNGLIFGTEE